MRGIKDIQRFLKSPCTIHVGLVLLAYAICTGVGLWVEDRYTESAVRQFLATSATADNAAPLQSLMSVLSSISIMTLAWTCVLAGIPAYMILKRFHEGVEREQQETAANVLKQTQTLVRTRDAVIFGLAKLAESRDPETGDHLERIAAYSSALAARARLHPKFRDEITPAFVRLIEISSVLHDIGKVGIEDSILLKRGPLTPAERLRMQTHTTIGGECLLETERRLGSSNFLQMAREIALSHHERWDGTGYPHALAGAAIPLAARIVAIADVYDALVSRRVYKGAMTHDECSRIVRQSAGSHFDPDLIDIWLEMEPQFRQIARRFMNDSPDCRDTGMTPAATPAAKADEEVPELTAGRL